MERRGYVPHVVDERTTLMLTPNMSVSGDSRVEQAVLTGKGIEPQRPRKNKTLIPIGGAATNDNLRTFIKHVQHDEAVTIITTPTSLPEEQFASYRIRFHQVGMREEPFHLGAHTLPEEGKTMLQLAGGTFITGGNQERGKAELEALGLDTELATQYDAGMVVGGTSAGAHMLGEVTSIGRENEFGEYIRDDIIPSLGLIKGLSFDSHVDKRFRNNRQETVVTTLTHKGEDIVSIGLSEGSGVIIHDDRQIEYFGRKSNIVWQKNGITDDKLSGNVKEDIRNLPRTQTVFSHPRS